MVFLIVRVEREAGKTRPPPRSVEHSADAAAESRRKDSHEYVRQKS